MDARDARGGGAAGDHVGRISGALGVVCYGRTWQGLADKVGRFGFLRFANPRPHAPWATFERAHASMIARAQLFQVSVLQRSFAALLVLWVFQLHCEPYIPLRGRRGVLAVLHTTQQMLSLINFSEFVAQQYYAALCVPVVYRSQGCNDTGGYAATRW